MTLPTLANSLTFLCMTGGVATAVYAMMLIRDANSKYEDAPEMKKKTKKKASLFIVLAVIFTAGRLLVTHYLK